MKNNFKKFILGRATWFILFMFAGNNLFFENWYGGNFEIDNTAIEYLLAIIATAGFGFVTFARKKATDLFERVFGF